MEIKSEKTEFIVDEQGSFTRLDKLLCLRMPEFTRSKIVSLIDGNNVRVNGIVESKSYKTKTGDRIEISIPPLKEFETTGQDIPLDIEYEDADIIVVNKPKGMVVHPAHGNEDGTLVNALLFHCDGTLSGINGVMRPGIVHRIDKDTSGLLVAAKNDAAHNGLAEQFSAHTIIREYRAIVNGNIKNDSGTVDKPIARHKTDRKRMACRPDLPSAKRAITHYTVLQRFNGFTYVSCMLETGRTHQIRVHMSEMGHFIIGDTVYGKKSDKINIDFEGQCLHAKTLGFKHPITGKDMYFDSKLPDYFQQVLDKISKL